MSASQDPGPELLASRLEILFAELARISPPQASARRSRRRLERSTAAEPSPEVTSYLHGVRQDLSLGLPVPRESPP